jgi:hypothetical protein
VCLGKRIQLSRGEAIAVVICGSLESAGSGDITSLSGGAFSHSSCDAMTSWMAEATVCESWLKVPGWMLVVLSSVIAIISASASSVPTRITSRVRGVCQKCALRVLCLR